MSCIAHCCAAAYLNWDEQCCAVMSQNKGHGVSLMLDDKLHR